MRPPTALALLAASVPCSAQEVLHSFDGSNNDSYGQVCDLVGDMDGDGRAEILVGAWRDDNGALADAGSCFIYDGKTGALVTNVFGSGAGDHMGYGSSSAGDADGDGLYDVCAAADEDNVGGMTNAGSARIVKGTDLSELHTTNGDNANDLYGWSTAAVGDVNGDGRDDVAVGALLDDSPTLQNCGSVTIVSGANGFKLLRVFGPVQNGNLGSHVGRAGDVNADGTPDFVAARGARALVYSGLDGSLLWDLPNTGAGGNGKVSGGVDVDLDGHDDLVCGAPSFQSQSGAVRVYSGANGGLLWEIIGSAGDQLGSSVVGAGDLNGDGYGDFAAGATGDDDGGGASGSIRAFSGKGGGEIFTIPGQAGNWTMGADCGGGHDVDGDGVNDVVVSSTGSSRAMVVSFAPLGTRVFGTGTPGCAGPQAIGANGVPSVGNAQFALHTSNAVPGAPNLLGLSTGGNGAGTPIAGALVHLALPPGGFLVTLPTAPADVAGSITRPLPIPNDPGLAGAALFAQFATFWPGPCPVPVSTSRALRITVQ